MSGLAVSLCGQFHIWTMGWQITIDIHAARIMRTAQGTKQSDA